MGSRAGAGMCARRRTYFSCLAKKRRQKKATLLSASLCACTALRATCGARARRGRAKLAALKQSRTLDPPGAALLGAYRRAGIPHRPSLRSALWGELESDPNGTYFGFFGCPCRRTRARARRRGSVSSGNDLGRRLTALGSLRPGRPATRCWAISTSRMSSPSSCCGRR